MVKLSGSQSLIKALQNEGANVLFGMPGGANLPIYDELSKSEIRHILVRHEQLAAHMADGFARVSRRPGVCLATSGPGATNLVTGIATAYMDSIPMVAITGQVATTSIGKDAFQECDIVGVASPVTKYAFQPTDPATIPSTVKKAFYIAASGRPGPVLIDIPKDTQTAEAETQFPDTVRIRGYNPVVVPDTLQIEKALDIILKAERPMILAGGGVAISGAYAELQALAEALMCPVATTFKGKGVFNETHPLALGPIGMHGHIEANRLILEADVLLAVGTRFSDRSTGKVSDFVPKTTVIHIDIDPSEINKNKAVDLGIVGDVKASLRALLEAFMRRARRNEIKKWSERFQEVKESCRNEWHVDMSKISAISVLKKLREVLPPDALVTTEVGQCQMWASLHFDVIEPGTFYSSTGLGTMGFGFPAAIGAKVAAPNRPVLDIAGDGSFNMTEAALATSVLDNIPVIVVIMNNTMLGMVAQWQRLFYERRYHGVKLYGVPDFVKLAEAYRAQGLRVQSIDEFAKAIKLGLRSDIATIIDIPISPEEDVFPFVVPGTALKDMIVA
ncbi:MAG TPA: biosynthetic-type acetolactate synthase large subunit [Nitrososphaerales archaeon]|nr:biosynthetic-type acetolactate synthase large subunit [Nitrososphaerales archaeon]